MSEQRAEIVFLPGDLVRLNSGGPVMSVVSDESYVRTVWFDPGNSARHEGEFPGSCLERVREPKAAARKAKTKSKARTAKPRRKAG